MQIFTGVVAIFKKELIEYSVLMLAKFVLYATAALILVGTKFSLVSVFLLFASSICTLDTIGYFSSAKITPIYVKIINNDMTSALVLSKSTANLVRVLQSAMECFDWFYQY